VAHKLEDNGLWESSRMILPEHKVRILESNKEFLNPRRERPVLDEQEWNYINELLTMSVNSQEPITVKFYDPYAPMTVTGIVERVDSTHKRVKLSGEWYPLDRITGVLS